jgi:hypothetical protein
MPVSTSFLYFRTDVSTENCIIFNDTTVHFCVLAFLSIQVLKKWGFGEERRVVGFEVKKVTAGS